MKCANPGCKHDIGLLSHRRHWRDNRRYCSKPCCDSPVATQPRQRQPERRAVTYFEWLFLQPIPNTQLRPIPALARSHQGYARSQYR